MAIGNGRDTDFWIDLNKGESPIRVWDKLILGGVVFPGLCRISGSGVGAGVDVAKYQVKAPSGTDPAQFDITLTDKGYNPGTLRATIEVWDVDQWEDFKETLPQFSPRTGTKYGSGLAGSQAAFAKNAKVKGRDAFDIVHPATALLGIDSVIVLNVSVPEVMDQTLVTVIDMMQYFPATGIRNLRSGGAAATASDAAVPKPGGNIKK